MDFSSDVRFRGYRNLVGQETFDVVRRTKVMVVGVGGVGSWVVEALARSGIGSIVLVDLDEVCITNVNRQIQALTDTVGASKVDVLADRVRLINPECEVVRVRKFFSETTLDEIFSGPLDVVVDCIDRVTNKALLIATCVARGIPVVTTGSAGNRLDPSAIKVEDLSRTAYDNLLIHVRKTLRQRHGFPRGERKKFGVPCVYLPQPPESAPPAVCSGNDESREPREGRRSCNDGLGTACFVTATFGMIAAAEALKVGRSLLRAPQIKRATQNP